MLKYLFLIILCNSLLPVTSAKEITEKEYLKADSALWNDYEFQQNLIWNKITENPEKRDSLRRELDLLLKKTLVTNKELAIKYSSTPSGLQRVFMVRNDIEKTRLKNIYENLPDTMKSMPYSLLLKEYIDADQLKEGDFFVPFECYLPNGSLYDWKDTNNRKILLVFSGLGCVGPDGRDIIKQWKDAGWIIIDYQVVNNLDQLKEQANIYDLGIISVADFKGEASPMKIKYNAQSMPTCYLIDENGIIKMITIGLTNKLIDAMGVKLEF